MLSLRALTYLTAYNVKHILTTRKEFILVPLVSTIASMLIVPYGLSRFTSSIAVGAVVAMGLLVTSIFLPSTITALYTIIELGIGLLDKYLTLPIPRHQVVLARFLASALLGLINVTVALILASIYGVHITPLGALAVYLMSIVLSLGVTGVVLFLSARNLDVQRASLMASIVNIILLNLSPLYFPLSVMPPALQVIMLINPASGVVEALRAIILGRGWCSVPTLILVSLVLNLAWFSAGVKVFVGRLRRL